MKRKLAYLGLMVLALAGLALLLATPTPTPQEQFEKWAEGNKELVYAVREASKQNLFTKQALPRALADAVSRGQKQHEQGQASAYVLAHLYQESARAAAKAGLDAPIIDEYAERAFDLHMESADEETHGLIYADQLAHEFHIDLERHQQAVVAQWARSGDCCSGLAQEFGKRHPLNPGLARQAWKLAMEKERWTRARVLAQGQRLMEEYKLARAQELQAQLETALEEGDYGDAYKLLMDPELSLIEIRFREAAEKVFQRAVRGKDHRIAIQIAGHPRSGLGEGVVQQTAERLYESYMGIQPLEAYRVALRYDLDQKLVYRAEQAAFRQALDTGRFKLARRMPHTDDVFMIIE